MGSQLVPQPFNGHRKSVVIHEFGFPYPRKQRFLRQRLSAVDGKDFQKLLLRPAEGNRLSAFCEGHLIKIQHQVVKAKAVFAFLRASITLPAPEDGIDSGPQNHEAKWLGNVVIASHFQSSYHIQLHIVGCQKNNGHIRALPDLPAKIKTIPVRQIHIQQNQIRRFGF